MLWRIDGLTETSLDNPQKLADGLRLHLQHTSLMSVLIGIGAEQRAYVALPGCAGCLHGRCRPGCATELFRRLLRSCAKTALLRAVPRGLASRRYTQICVAWPTRLAQPLDAEWAGAWSESRLHVGFPAGSTLHAAVLVAVGDGGPALRATLRTCGWNPLPLPSLITRRWLTAQPGRLWAPYQMLGDPWLLMPIAHPNAPLVPFSAKSTRVLNHRGTETLSLQSDHDGDRTVLIPSDSAPDRLEAPSPVLPTESGPTEELSSRLLADLRAVLAGEQPFRRITRSASSEPETNEPGSPELDLSPFPVGPGSGKSAMRPHDVEAWVAGMLAHPQGYTRKTIAALLAEPHKEHATVLLLWLEHAQLLGAATDPAQPYRYPRALVLHDDALIADRLRATPLPDAIALKAAKSRGL